MKRKQHTRDETDTTTIESRMWSIQAAVAYPRARSARTLRDPANLRARSVRAWKRCPLSSSKITKASNSSGRVLVTLVLVNPKRIHLVAGSTRCGQFRRLWPIFVRGQFGLCATRQIFVRGQFALRRPWQIFVRGQSGPCATRQNFVRGQLPKLRIAWTTPFVVLGSQRRLHPLETGRN